MPICAVRTCGERGRFACKKSEGQIISFHRFPSDKYPRIRAKWIRATGQRKTKSLWKPTRNSTICSKHFNKEDFLTCTDLKSTAVPRIDELDDPKEQGLLDGVMKDSVDNCDTDSADDIIPLKLAQNHKSIRNKELNEEDNDVKVKSATTTSSHEQPQSNQPITIQDSEPETSELEIIEINSSEAKSNQLSVDAIENPQGSDERPPYGIKIPKAYSTRKHMIMKLKNQTNNKNIQMYRMDPVTKTVQPFKSVIKESSLVDSPKQKIILRKNTKSPEKPIYFIKKSAEPLEGNSQNTKVNQNCFPRVQYANNVTENIAPEIGNKSNRGIKVITLSMFKEEQKKVYSIPVPKMAQVNQYKSGDDTVYKMLKAANVNPTIETAGRVEKNRKHKPELIRKITPFAKMAKTPAGYCAPQLLLPLNDSNPTPTDSMPTSTVSTPTSTFLTPSPAYSMPSLADSTPSPTDSMTMPADSTPTDSKLTPVDSMQISPHSNIHTPDEYDTFAKHVATQLRQLSLQSYLSAQEEIQSTLSKYRLCDLNAIKKNP